MRKLAAIMFTDIVGYTALMGEDEASALQLLQKNRDLQKSLIQEHKGEWLKEMGDGSLSSFSSAVEAVICALEIQRSLKDDPDLTLRIGIHIGDVVFEKGDVFGDGVNVASRIEPMAEPGGICISDRVYDDIQNKPDIDAVYLGEKELKHVKRPIKVYALTGEGLPKTITPAKVRWRVRTLSLQHLVRPQVALPGALVIALITYAVVWFVHRSNEVRWARQEAIPKIYQLAEAGDWHSAYALATQAEQIIPADSMLIKVWPSISRFVRVNSDPPGARVYRKPYTIMEYAWEYLGQTPIDSIRISFGVSRLKLEKEGFTTVYKVAYHSWISGLRFKLHHEGDMPANMIWVPGGKFTLKLPGLDYLDSAQVKDYFIDQFEVTNKEFKRFVGSGGYQKREYWKHHFIKDGKELSWEEAMAEFTDETGRPGPATWEVGDYPNGEDNYPVAGVCWYEAVAYAEFAGKALPTIYHWSRAAGTVLSSFIVSLSNYNSRGPSPVGTKQGMSTSGAYDMAGNVREWCWNEGSGSLRYILGGGWNDEPYTFNDAYTQPSFDRSPTNGFRCVKYSEDAQNLAYIGRPIPRLFRDYYREKPVSDEVFDIYLNMYAYDKTELNAVIESVDEQSEDWVREKITFDAAYGGERVIAYLFLPKNFDPPYQTTVYFPGSQVIHASSIESMRTSDLKFLVKSGRAVMYPIYKGTYERGDKLDSDYPNETKFYRDHVIMWAQDLSRSIDYLETRPDIDTKRLAYYGVSWGAAMGAIMPAVEKRFKASILYIAGLGFEPALPEVDQINFVSRVTIPMLMLNGKYDHYFPLETSQKPMFQLLGTPPEHKRHVVYETGHFVPRTQLIKESLEWLDRYLGPVKP